MGRPDIPVEKAKAYRNLGLSWKQVARKLEAEGYPLYWHNNLARACKRENSRTRKPTYSVNIPLAVIRDLRGMGFKWKEIPALLVAKGYPRWHPSTLCGAFVGSSYDLSRKSVLVARSADHENSVSSGGTGNG